MLFAYPLKFRSEVLFFKFGAIGFKDFDNSFYQVGTFGTDIYIVGFKFAD